MIRFTLDPYDGNGLRTGSFVINTEKDDEKEDFLAIAYDLILGDAVESYRLDAHLAFDRELGFCPGISAVPFTVIDFTATDMDAVTLRLKWSQYETRL